VVIRCGSTGWFLSSRRAAFEAPRDLRAELDRPHPNGLVADLDAPLGQHLRDIAQAQGEAKLEPDCVQDDLPRKPAAFERQLLGQCAAPVGFFGPISGDLLAFARQHPSEESFPTDGPLFVGLVTAIILILAGLQYFPALALGPVIEHFRMTGLH